MWLLAKGMIFLYWLSIWIVLAVTVATVWAGIRHYQKRKAANKLWSIND
jgi:hypothetical protein